MINAHFVVPRRDDHGVRDRLWRYCQSYWTKVLPDIPITEGHHATGPFNRAAAINSAVSQLPSDWDVVVILDGDVLALPEQVTRAISVAHETEQLTLGYNRYEALDQTSTQYLMRGSGGPRRTRLVMGSGEHISSIVAVPRSLWNRSQGFDERFRGWGHEDGAFFSVCSTIGKGTQEIPGVVTHLHHPYSRERRMNPNLRAAKALANRYWAAMGNPVAILQILSERLLPEGIAVFVVTDGRHDYITQAIPSLTNLKGLPITRRVIVDDSGDPSYQEWLRDTFPDFELIHDDHRLGYSPAMSRVWEAALASGHTYVWWHEDDFVIHDPVDVSAMAATLDAEPDLANVVLLRQPWFEQELRAESLIKLNPDAYTLQSHDGHERMEHTLGYWLNPHLVKRDTLAQFKWPKGSHTEFTLGRQMVRHKKRFAFWGNGTQGVTHIGEKRHGTGY